MSFEQVAAVANAVLYEGMMLYPYRTSAFKNKFRWLFGVIPPNREAADTANGMTRGLQCECLFVGSEDLELEARLRFLQPSSVRNDPVLCEVDIGPVRLQDLVETVVGKEFEAESTRGIFYLKARAVAGAFRLTVVVRNLTVIDTAEAGDVDAMDAQSMVSTQVLLRLTGGRFVSLRDPGNSLKEEAANCNCSGLWPVLIGDVDRMLLCSPIILDDHAQVAPESPGDFFDATEIDELLTLRILTLTEGEKSAMAKSGRYVSELLARTETLGQEQLQVLHGAFRKSPASIGVGDRVRLKPSGRSDIFDLSLSGRLATVCALEEDFDGRRYVVVTVEDDPGQDLGVEGQPGHRFFFAPDEVELITSTRE